MLTLLFDLDRRGLPRLIQAVFALLPLAFSATATAAETGERVTFGSNWSMQLPAGWSNKQEGKVLRAEGHGATLNAMVVKTEKSIDEFIRGHMGIHEKKPGYKLIDEDAVKTSAGNKGKLAYYEYTRGGDKVTEVTVYIGAKDQIAVLIFGIPNGALKKYEDDIESVFSSLQTTDAG